MQRIHPITEEGCRPHYGKPVLIYLVDGTEIHGTMSRMESGKLILNEKSTDHALKRIKTKRKNVKARAVKKAHGQASSAQTAVLGGPYGYDTSPYSYGYGYGRGFPLVFDLASIAAIFF